MIISRKEFHRRSGFGEFHTIEEKKELMSVEKLYKEIIADASFRNHDFMFDKNINLEALELQEEDGIKKLFPEITTEKQRYDKIKEEIVNDTYESVPVSRDIDYPDVIYVDNGFHRIFIAHEMGLKVIRTNSRYGKFVLHNNISFNDLIVLLDMLSHLFKEKLTIIELNEFLKMLIEKNPSMGETYSIGYGREK